MTFFSGFTGCTTTTDTLSIFHPQEAIVTLPGGCSMAASAATSGASISIDGVTNPDAGDYAASHFDVFTTLDATPALAGSDIPIYAHVSFDPHGRSGGIMADEVYSGTTLALTTNAFTYAGYNFTGWNTHSDGSGTGLQRWRGRLLATSTRCMRSGRSSRHRLCNATSCLFFPLPTSHSTRTSSLMGRRLPCRKSKRRLAFCQVLAGDLSHSWVMLGRRCALPRRRQHQL